MASIDTLPPDQRAVLDLVLQRGRSYDDIARLLAIDRAAVRARALAAFDELGPDTGLAPDIDLPLDFVAADVCAAAIRHISLSAEGTGRTYHLASPKHALLSSLVDRLRELARHAARDPSHPMAAFVPLFIDRDSASGLTVAEMYLEHVFPSYSRSNTEHALQGSGIAFPPVNGQLLDRNIDRLMESGFLAAPPARRLPSHAG